MSEGSEKTDAGNALSVVIAKLTPKNLAVLLGLCLVLLATILAVAVYRGSSISLFGIRIGAPSNHNASPGPAGKEKVHVKLQLNFNPNELNPRQPGLRVVGYIKTGDGRKVPVPIRHGIDPGGIYVEADLDVRTPFFVEIRTPERQVWKTDDYSVTRAYLTAYKIPEME